MCPVGLGSKLLGPDATSPIPLLGLTLWLKADAGLYSVANHWSDQSGNGNDFIGPGGGGNPTVGTGINGRATAEFNGSSQYFETSPGVTLGNLITNTTFSLFGVARYTGLAGRLGGLFTPPIMIDESGYFGVFGFDAAGTYKMWASTNVPANPTPLQSTAYTLGDPQQFAFIQANVTVAGNGQSLVVGTSAPIVEDGVALAALAARVCLGNYVGVGAGYWQGSIGEIICYNRAVSGGESTSILAYLKTKFGL